MYLLNIEHKRREIQKNECCALLPLLCIGGNLMNICRWMLKPQKSSRKCITKEDEWTTTKKLLTFFKRRRRKACSMLLIFGSIKNHTKERKNPTDEKLRKISVPPFFAVCYYSKVKLISKCYLIFFCRCLKKTQTSIATVTKHIFIISQSPRSELNKVHIVCWKSDRNCWVSTLKLTKSKNILLLKHTISSDTF